MNNTLRNAGHVRRYHTLQTIGHQTVAEHSYFLTMILLELTQGQASCRLIKAALFHDLPEVITGDIPATAKWKSPCLVTELKAMEDEFEDEHDLFVALTDEEKLLLKFADMSELVLYSLDQLRLGNRNMLEVGMRGIDYLQNMPFVSPAALKMMNELITEMEKFK